MEWYIGTLYTRKTLCYQYLPEHVCKLIYFYLLFYWYYLNWYLSVTLSLVLRTFVVNVTWSLCDPLRNWRNFRPYKYSGLCLPGLLMFNCGKLKGRHHQIIFVHDLRGASNTVFSLNNYEYLYHGIVTTSRK